eukprot:CAMPEP_0116985282 /NCGR_PEP_ID=MMETSP0467-20121206/62152_1 /TAXON_ID=283647 /ORGANISM="Mesodinium pulex, Strain SPMC105" /LENGTH=130 /DNA_ID=CAMNT_0004680549 /DNA_START=1094 /DNA_END=1486 /DNA_ORIENTATION=+
MATTVMTHSCWTCYCLFEELNQPIEEADKEFCSQECLQQFKLSETVSCECGVSFYKPYGIFNTLTAKWKCTETCSSSNKPLNRNGFGNENGTDDIDNNVDDILEAVDEVVDMDVDVKHLDRDFDLYAEGW